MADSEDLDDNVDDPALDEPAVDRPITTEAANLANAQMEAFTAVVLFAGAPLLAWWMNAKKGIAFTTEINSPNFNPLCVIPFVLALVGLLFAFNAVRGTIRYRKFGKSFLELPHAARLGEILSGKVRTSRDLRPGDDYKILLRCIETTWDTTSVKTNKHRHVDHTRWQAEQIVARGVGHSSDGIPFQFEIPSGEGVLATRGNSERAAAQGVRWMLEVTAPFEGLAYYAIFLVRMSGQRPHADREITR